jgi:hypothetical protein
MSSRPRRLAVLAVATTLAAAPSTAQAAASQSSTPAQSSAHWVVVPETVALKPPANVTALARDLGVDTDFAWRTLDELVRSRGPAPARPAPTSRQGTSPGPGDAIGPAGPIRSSPAERASRDGNAHHGSSSRKG